MSFSVAINAFDRENEIGETLEAVLRQTLAPEEVVVVDDGSRDATASVVQSFAPRVRLVRIANIGQGLSRDRAIRECKQAWVATCDSDDLWAPDHLEALKVACETSSDVVLVFTNSTRFGRSEPEGYDHFARAPGSWWDVARSLPGGLLLFPRGTLYSNLLSFNPIYPSAAAFERGAYQRIAVNPVASHNPAEDFDVAARMSRLGDVVGVQAISVSMRKHDNNVSSRMCRNLLGRTHLLDTHLCTLELALDERDRVRRTRNELLHRAFDHACWENDALGLRVCLERIPRSSLSWGRRARLARTRLMSLTTRSVDAIDPAPWLSAVASV